MKFSRNGLLLSPLPLLFVVSFLSKTTHSFLIFGTGTTSPKHGTNGKRFCRPVMRRIQTSLYSIGNSSNNNSTSTFRSISQPNLVRGEKYKSENSTLPSPAIIAAELGVQPTKEASKKTWQRAWKLHKRLIPLLHSTDSCKPPDSSLNLACMWWKGLSGNDRSSPVYDNELAYDLLPSGWRKIIRLRRLYPRLHHGNVELRTAYLDSQISEIATQQQKITNSSSTSSSDDNRDRSSRKTKKIRLVCMGAGYDTRGIKMIERKTADQVIELDLPQVVSAKERLFQRLLKRRPWLKEFSMPTLVPSDFNDLPDVEQKLRGVLLQECGDSADEIVEWHTIFVFEGVMIYLNDGVPSSLLNLTSRILHENGMEGSLCFADRLENVPGGELDSGVNELKNNGWEMKDWSPKPGLARHMGSASLSTTIL